MHPGRRTFLRATATAAAAVRFAYAKDAPPGVRATSGDSVEPDWNQRLTITVGPQKADLTGSDEKALQAAVDYVTRFGGGTVHILPGLYKLRNAVYLTNNVRILGSGADSVLVKEPQVSSPLAADSDWYDQEITLADSAGFRIGDGICLRAKNPHNGGNTVIKRTLVARSGNRFKLDRALRENLWLTGKPTATTLFPLFSGENIAGIVIEDITLDGNKANNDLLDGNFAGCVFLQDCNRVTMRKVEARNYHGDGLSWQVCHDVLVEVCHTHDHTGLGFHPGSGSQRTVIRRSRSEHNDIGIFFCWGVRYGLAEHNTLVANRKFGVSIGHRDTDNRIVENDIRQSGEAGILFRKERDINDSPNRNLVEANSILDSGKADGVAIDVQGFTQQAHISRNRIRESRQPAERIGIRVGALTDRIVLADNRIEGYKTAIEDLRKR